MKTIEEFSLTTMLLKQLYIGKVELGDKSQELYRILKKHPKLLVAQNHGSSVGAFAGLVALTDMYHRSGGSDRKMFGVTWRTFYQLPVLRQVFSYLTQVDEAVSFDTAYELLTGSDFSDCCIMPEGELCNFGNGRDVQPFLSPRFIELAIKAKVPVLVVSHLGSENWSWAVEVDKKYQDLLRWLPHNMKKAFKDSGLINIPKPYRKKLDKLYISFYLYQPRLTEWDLSEDSEERQQQLWSEANWVRKKMQMMIAQLAEQASTRKEPCPA